ncbi:MAG: hypothetical protein IPL53_21195, partial [Ignavibacteria bacterium]|nr:hypothetical protein [Ignavibacteria bacterium]
MKFNLNWEDKMLRNSGYNITGAARQYKYLITYSSDGGFTWPDSLYSEGYALINSTQIFHKKINLDSLMNLRTGLNVILRVTDILKPNRISTTLSLPVRLNKLTKARIDFVWDYSYPAGTLDVTGACADGVSRF